MEKGIPLLHVLPPFNLPVNVGLEQGQYLKAIKSLLLRTLLSPYVVGVLVFTRQGCGPDLYPILGDLEDFAGMLLRFLRGSSQRPAPDHTSNWNQNRTYWDR